ncbi:MAG: TraL conjugative transposon family protein [Odoribacter sp.]|nr:TraL conjugative transposon family protein [Odoribacter sp.]
MMQKIITRLQDWVDVKLRNHCDRLPKSTQRKIVLAMLGIFAFFSLSLFGYSLYRLGENEGQEMAVEHLRLLPDEITRIHKEIKP